MLLLNENAGKNIRIVSVSDDLDKLYKVLDVRSLTSDTFVLRLERKNMKFIAVNILGFVSPTSNNSDYIRFTVEKMIPISTCSSRKYPQGYTVNCCANATGATCSKLKAHRAALHSIHNI